MRVKPTKKELEEMLEKNWSLNKISEECGWCTATVSKLCDEYELEKPGIGRPKGFKVSEKTKQKMRRLANEGRFN